jgi:hypothetical protein
LNGTLAGWYILETGSNSNTTYTAGTGSDTAGDTYSYGASASTERALGSIASSKLETKFGAQFTNNTGNTIDQLQISYVGEEWRFDPSRGTTIKDQIVFEYSTNATSLTTGTWTAVTALMYETTNLTGTAGLRNGNDPAYRTALSNIITGLNINAGQTFWIRFVDVNVSGTDDGLAVDDFSLTPQNSSFLSVNDISKTKNIFLKNTMVDNTLSFQTKGNASVKVYNTNGQDYERFQPDLMVYHDAIHDYSTNEPTMDGTACLTNSLNHSCKFFFIHRKGSIWSTYFTI